MKKFKNVILGGTFDHFHPGHKALLNKAFTIGDKVEVGITQENLYKKKFLAQTIEEYSVREKSVREYLKSKNWLSRAKFTPIYDVFGPSVKEKNIQAVVASTATLANAKKINLIRKEKGFPEIQIVIIQDVLAQDGKLLTSERIRAGEINREGKIYLNIFKKTLDLPENLRETLRKPLGEVFEGKENELKETVHKVIKFIKLVAPVIVIAVGDIIAKSLSDNGFEPDVKIIDGRSRRQEIIRPKADDNFQRKYLNNPGTISSEAVAALQKVIHRLGGQLVIDGEEDLITLPAIILSPLNSVVLYGQMDLGVVAVVVNEEKKEEIQGMLKKFK